MRETFARLVERYHNGVVVVGVLMAIGVASGIWYLLNPPKPWTADPNSAPYIAGRGPGIQLETAFGHLSADRSQPGCQMALNSVGTGTKLADAENMNTDDYDRQFMAGCQDAASGH
ncbi:MAG: hypothetical protein U0R76_07440 [Candidatus Nanopelagicales bacterium]